MSRKQRFSRSPASQRRKDENTPTPMPAGTEPDEIHELPPRRKKFPSSIHKITKWYYNLIFFLFVCLVVFLFWYGNKFSP